MYLSLYMFNRCIHIHTYIHINIRHIYRYVNIYTHIYFFFLKASQCAVIQLKYVLSFFLWGLLRDVQWHDQSSGNYLFHRYGNRVYKLFLTCYSLLIPESRWATCMIILTLFISIFCRKIQGYLQLFLRQYLCPYWYL